MPYDSNGNFSLAPGYLAVNGETILPSQHNPPLEDIASALGQVLLRSGGAPMVGALNMGGFRVTNIAEAEEDNQAASFGQLGLLHLPEIRKTANYTLTAEDAGRAIIGNASEAITFSLPGLGSAGTRCHLVRNTGTAPLVLNPAGSEQIEGASSLALKPGDAALIWPNGTAWKAFISWAKPRATRMTGEVIDWAFGFEPEGWLFLSEKTIGNATSFATARANADSFDLFKGLWETYDNTRLHIQTSAGVETTRGANAEADFAANKRLPLLDARGRVIAGRDNMGGASANRLTNRSGGVNGDVLGDTGGAETHTLTLDQLARHAHGLSRYSRGPDDDGAAVSGPGTSTRTDYAGGDEPHNNVQPTLILNKLIKL